MASTLSVQTAPQTATEYEAEFELLMQELAELTKPRDQSEVDREKAETEQLKAEIKGLREETRAILTSMGAKF